ncbi:hypothetical protein [Legionella shakespearei]|uniref:Uncharacterized protein n=1 Tax=Legionella shakespearei DSM 23087 TaxID=1122169 RepID=A0A0W0Z753_9GAMM|nr:hypothetical protein [Legionella shakespearei]KTD64953.1 hypothetical protein Lsha_0322 [Legionella shakespearei DSM 23087]
MKSATLVFSFFVTLALSTGLFAADDKNWTLSPEGFGPIQINMTLKEAEQASGLTFNSTKPDPDQAEDESCHYVTLKGLDDVSFMVSDGKIVRVNLSSAAYKTSTGAKIGDTESQVQNLYNNKLQVETHRYDEKGNYLTLIDTAKDRAIRFETDGKVVTLIYGGRNNEVHFVEDCL